MLEEILTKNQDRFSPVMDYKGKKIIRFDLSVDNKELYSIDLSSAEKLGEYLQKKLDTAHADFGIGGYREDRLLYHKSEHFGKGDNARTIHLGIDIWKEANSPVFAPVEGEIHSFYNNDIFGDYGPTIILKHRIESEIFYTLYGHLSLASLKHLEVGEIIQKGQKFCDLGNLNENGNWPPHLHFQLIKDMFGKKGDFPGVTNIKEKEKYFENCPNPNYILNLGILQ